MILSGVISLRKNLPVIILLRYKIIRLISYRRRKIEKENRQELLFNSLHDQTLREISLIANICAKGHFSLTLDSWRTSRFLASLAILEQFAAPRRAFNRRNVRVVISLIVYK